MVSSKKLLQMATNWQRFEVSKQNKRVTFRKTTKHVNEDCCTTSTSAVKTERGQFVVYSYDQQRFTIPLHFLNNQIFIQLLNMSEEEYGLQKDGPIVLPVDSQLLSYIISVLQKGLTKDVREALLMSVDTNRCASSSFNPELRTDEHLFVY